MKSVILSGPFRGRRIILHRGAPAISLGKRQFLSLAPPTLRRAEVLYIRWTSSAVSGWGRGLAGSLLGRSMQYSAIQSAHRIPVFHCRLQFLDGSISLARLNEKTFLSLSALVEIH